MAIRVLTAIKYGNKLIGFKIISSNRWGKFVNLKQAEEIYNKERFENVKFDKKTGRWSGTECSIDKLPVQDKFRNYVKADRKAFVINKLEENGKVIEYTLMDIEGGFDSYSVEKAIALADTYKLINAEVVRNVANPYIRGRHWEIPNKDASTVWKTQQNKAPSQNQQTQTKAQPQPQQQKIKDVNVGGNRGNMDSKLQRMKELVPLLRKAAEVYEQGKDEIMSNFEYDKLYDELKKLEDETGVIMADSVTQEVGYTVQSKLAKVTHPSKMLSLDKTKNVDDLATSLGGQDGFLGWKLDGLTVVATYEGGKLLSAVTRGNGSIGEDITENYKTFSNVPLKIEYKGRLVLRGEALIRKKISIRTQETLQVVV